MIHVLKNPQNAAHLFAGWQEAIIWSCLDGTMGSIYADREETPNSAAAQLGDFAFFTGEPCEELLAETLRRTNRFLILVPQTPALAALMESALRDRAQRTVRYALKKEPDVFCRKILERYAATLPAGFSLCAIDKTLYERLLYTDWARDLVSNYETYGAFATQGRGFAVLCQGEIAAGASSYCSYRGGIEIEVDTKACYRRRGLAKAAAATLMLDCLAHGLYPSWDAQNKASLALAQKLGYHFDKEYPCYLFDPVGSASQREKTI